jgi:hypothetical protein
MRKLALFIACLLLGGCVAYCGLFALTDIAYNRLEASQHKTRKEVEEVLRGFRGQQILNPQEMQPILRTKLGPGWQYWRYTKYLSFSIDVVYAEHDHVYSIWPEYE